MRLSLVLLIAFSCTIKAADEINTEVFGQLKDYILDDPATQGVLISKITKSYLKNMQMVMIKMT